MSHLKVYLPEVVATYYLTPRIEQRFGATAHGAVQLETYPWPKMSMFDPLLFEPTIAVVEQWRAFLNRVEDGALVGMSLLCLQDYCSFTLFYQAYEAQLHHGAGKKLSIVVGGAMLPFLSSSELLEQFPLVAAFVLGPGERVLVEIIDALLDGKSFDRLQTGTEDDAVLQPSSAMVDITKEYFTAIARGQCEWARCKFCHHLSPFKMPADAVGEFCENIIRVHKEKGCVEYSFIDNYLSPAALETILRTLMDAGLAGKLRIRLTGVRMNAEMTELAALAKRAAVIRSLTFGIESGSQAVLTRWAKGLSLRHVEPTLKAWSEVCKVASFCMIGLPLTSDEEIEESFAAFRSWSPWIWLAIGSWFVLSPATGVWQNHESFGVTIGQPYRVCDMIGVDFLGRFNIQTTFHEFQWTMGDRTLTRSQDWARYAPHLSDLNTCFTFPDAMWLLRGIQPNAHCQRLWRDLWTQKGMGFLP